MATGGGPMRLTRGWRRSECFLRDVDPILRILGWENVRVVVARDFFARLLGMLAPSYRAGRSADGLVMVFPDCSSVHTWFMKRDLDIVFLDRGGAMLRIYWGVRPGRLIFCPGARMVIERVSIEEFRGQGPDNP